jgi:hypothetical protein
MNCKRRVAWLFSLLSFVLIFALCERFSAAAGQTAATGQIVGTVTDPSKAAIAQASVMATNEATGQSRTAKTNDEGDFVIPLLPPGNYSVVVGAQGFKTQTSTHISVEVATTATVNIRLQLGEASQQVTVEAAADILQTDSAANGNVVNDKTVPALPLSSRNYTQILDLAPGVSGSVPNAGNLGKNSVDVFVNGGRIMDNSYQMDGQDAGNMETQGTGAILSIGGISIPNPDAIQEFKVQTSLYDASYGRGAGANVNVVTKSGTDRIHGGVFEFLRNDIFNANDFFLNRQGVKRPPLKQNQFGGTIGGPIIKRRLFYFGSYQGTRQINGVSSNSVANAILPGLTNDRSAAGLGAVFGGLTGANGGTIAADGSNINPVALKLLNLKVAGGGFLIPTPQKPTNADPQGGPQGTSSFSIPSKFNEDQYIVNVDFLATSKHTISEKFFYAKSPEFLAFTSSNVPGSGTTDLFKNWNGNIKDTFVVTPTLINEFSFGYHRAFGHVASENAVTNQSIGLTPGCSSPFMPIMVIGSLELSGNFNDGQFTAPTAWAAQDQISWTHGKHNIRAGFGWERNIADSADQEVTRGDIVLPTFEDFLLGMSAAQTGKSSSLSVSDDLCGDTTRAFHVSALSGFAQDDIKLNPHLTVNLGLRWEGIGQTSDGKGKLVDFWPSLASNDLAANPFSGFIAASNFPGSIPSGIARNSNPTFAKNAWSFKNFGPRVGAAWTPARFNNKLVVRGGYGLYFTHPPVNDAFQLIVNPPFFSRQTNIGALNALATLQNPFNPPSNEVFPNFVPRTANSALTINSINPNWQAPRTQQWNLGIQYAINGSTSVQVSYVGTHSDRIETTNSINQALLASPSAPVNGETTNTTANAVNRVPILGIAPSGLNQATWIGISNYNSLQVNLQRRLARGIQFGVAYTYGKTLTDITGVGTFPLGGGSYNDQLNPMNGYGPADFDTRHRFVANYLWNLPSFRNNQGVVGKILSGWGASGVAVVQSGPALTFTDPGGGSIYGFGGPFSPVGASLCSGKTVADIQTSGSVQSRLDNYFNASAFCSAPAIGDGTGFGTLGRGVVYGPGQHNMDMSIFKDTHVGGLSESGTVQFRTEFFNTFNTPQFASQTTTQFSTSITQIGAPSFGHITATTVSPRIIQFGLKYTF